MTTDLTLDYRDDVGEIHRKKFGQFFTDPRIASFMVNWVLASGYPEVYDPAFGLGAFYKATDKTDNASFTASEIDPLVFNFWKRHHRSTNLDVRQEDYLLTWGRTHSNIVCNPPYMRFQKFINRDQVFRCFEQKLGLRLSGYTNIASAFLLKSLSELRQGGRLAYIMPLEFLNAGYGTLVKQKLLENYKLKAFIRFDCEKDAFPEVTTSVGMILVDSASEVSEVKFYNIKNISDLHDISKKEPNTTIPISLLRNSEKWLQHFQSVPISYNTECLVPLEYYGRFSRGIATGANDFFVGSENHFKKLGIKETEITACITKSNQIRRSYFSQADYNALKNADANVFLFSPNGLLSQGAQAYIRAGENAGYHQRFLTKNRTPWYKTEVRSPSPLLLGVFSRGGYKIVKNASNSLNLTCYHGFQPNLFGLSYIDHLYLYLLSEAGRKLLSLSMRQYGDMLDKFEPNDLNKALVPTPDFFDAISKSDIQEAIAAIQTGTDLIPAAIQEIFNEILNMHRSENAPSTRAANMAMH